MNNDIKSCGYADGDKNFELSDENCVCGNKKTFVCFNSSKFKTISFTKFSIQFTNKYVMYSRHTEYIENYR